MEKQSHAMIERGMEAVAKLPDIIPQKASDRIKPIYEDIQQTLHVPLVNLIFRTLANYPDYLESAWKQIRPVAQTRSFEVAADKLRASAVLANTPAQSITFPIKGGDELRSFNDTIHYVLPKLLLIVAALHGASEPGDDVQRKHREQLASPNDEENSNILPGIAEGTGKVQMIEPDKAGEPVATLFDAIKQCHNHPVVSSYYRGLANWPEFLRAVWNEISQQVRSTEYEECRHSLISQAQDELRSWPAFAIPMADTQRSELRDILSAFLWKFVPEMMLDAGMVKTLVEGTEAARTSRFSAAS